MKNILLVLAIIFLGFKSQSQLLNIPDKLKLEERLMFVQNTERNGFTIIIDGDEQDITKQFSSYLKETYKWSLKSKSKLLISEDLYNTEISEKHFDIQAMVHQTGEGNELRYFMNFGTDIYVNSKDYLKESNKCKEVLKNFAKYYYSSFMNGQIALKEKEIKSSNKTLAGIIKDINSNDKSNSKAEVKIKQFKKSQIKSEEKIRQMKIDIDKYEIKIDEKEKNLNTINNSGTNKDVNAKAKSNAKAKIKIEKLKKQKIKTQEKMRQQQVSIDKNKVGIEEKESVIKSLDKEKTNLIAQKHESESELSMKKSSMQKFETVLVKINNY